MALVSGVMNVLRGCGRVGANNASPSSSRIWARFATTNNSSNLQSTSRASPKVPFDDRRVPKNRGRRLLQWLAVSVGAGCTYAGYHQYRKVKARDNPAILIWPKWKVGLYSTLPLNALSRFAGRMATVTIPKPLRTPLFGTYSWFFNCRMDEATESDLTIYATLAEFFNRPIRPLLRPISVSELVCPADGSILKVGAVEDLQIEQVKGVDYSLVEFTGEDERRFEDVANLYYCVLYLAPGDYHGFHSPAQWQAKVMRYFPGLLLSISPWVVRRVKNLFSINERVVMIGSWQYGFFSFAAVAATNVGNISLVQDPELKTNARNERSLIEKPLVAELSRGDKIGEFRFGSSVVLVFEAPSNFMFTVRSGDKVKYGQSLGLVI